MDEGVAMVTDGVVVEGASIAIAPTAITRVQVWRVELVTPRLSCKNNKSVIVKSAVSISV